MDGQEETLLREQLTQLRARHRDLDAKINAIETDGARDQLTITRLKKQKLQIKDQIANIEDKLFPDIIA